MDNQSSMCLAAIIERIISREHSRRVSGRNTLKESDLYQIASLIGILEEL